MPGEIIKSFLCSKDNDIDSFLRERAVLYENEHKSRTYFIFDKTMQESHAGNPLMAFFTVALNVLEFDETLSNRKRKDLDGIFSKRNNKPIQNMPVFLIGQLAKNELYDGGPFCGQVIVDHALHELAKAQMHVGGRIVLVECKQEEKLISFYKEYGFDEFTHIPDDMRKENMVQFIMKL